MDVRARHLAHEELRTHRYVQGARTRDASALERDDERYFPMNRPEEKHGRPDDRALFEIQFRDGFWMLAREDDLVASTIELATTNQS